VALRIGRYTRPRRPLHLRWMHIKVHPVSFAGVASSVILILLVVALVAGAAPAILLAPISLGFATWLFTNRATYLNRWPVTLAS